MAEIADHVAFDVENGLYTNRDRFERWLQTCTDAEAAGALEELNALRDLVIVSRFHRASEPDPKKGG